MAKKVLFVINSIQIGGAERQLLYILKYLNRDKFIPHLILFRKIGKEKELLPKDINFILCPVSSNPFMLFYGLLKFLYTVLKIRPAYIISYMWRTNLLSIIIGRLARTPVIASERIYTIS